MMMTLGYITFGFIVGCVINGTVITIKEYRENKGNSYECEEK